MFLAGVAGSGCPLVEPIQPVQDDLEREAEIANLAVVLGVLTTREDAPSERACALQRAGLLVELAQWHIVILAARLEENIRQLQEFPFPVSIILDPRRNRPHIRKNRVIAQPLNPAVELEVEAHVGMELLVADVKRGTRALVLHGARDPG